MINFALNMHAAFVAVSMIATLGIKTKIINKMTNKKEQAPANDVLTVSEAFITKYKKPIVVTAAAVVVLIVGFFCYKNYVSAPREDKASTALGLCQQYFDQGMFDKALNGDGANCVGFVKIASDYSGTDAANLANLYAGLSYAHTEKWEKAAEYLDKYSTASDALVSPAAVAARGQVYANLNKIDEAVSDLKKAAKMADSKGHNGVNNSLSPLFLLSAAQLLESQNKNDEALEIYKDIKANYVTSALVQSQEIDKYIQRLEEK